MKKIRGMVKFCVSVIIISIILIFSIKLDNINELLLGALLGSVISIVSTIYVEYTNFISQQRNYIIMIIYLKVFQRMKTIGELMRMCI